MCLFDKIDEWLFDKNVEWNLRLAKQNKVKILPCYSNKFGEGFVFEVTYNHTLWFHSNGDQGGYLAHLSYVDDVSYEEIYRFFEEKV